MHGDGGTDLRTAIALLPTPSVADAMGGHERRGGNRGGELLLKGLVKDPERWGQYAPAIERHTRTFRRTAPNPTEPGPKGSPRLAAKFAEWMMGLPDGWVTEVPHVTRNQALKALGNGVIPAQAEHAINICLDRFEA